MEISEENPIRLLDLNKYPLTEEQTKDPQLIQWTKEILGTFTSNLTRYPEFRQTVNPFVYMLPSSMKLSKYGARHFVMKEQCALDSEEIKALRAEAPNKYSPYWYGMISTCHFSGHITLRIAQLLFPSVRWHIVQTMGHTFVTNIPLETIKSKFSTNSPLSQSINEQFPGSRFNRELTLQKRKTFAEQLSNILVDKAEYNESAPMIIDILVTEKKMFLELVARSNAKYIKLFNSANAFRKSLVNVGNIRPRKSLRNYFSGKGGKRTNRKTRKHK